MNQAIMNKLGISLFDVKDINDASGNNLFSMYTLPVNGKSVSEGEGSRKIAKWLGRFLKEENGRVAIANRIFEMYLLNLFIAEESLRSDMFLYGQSSKNQFAVEHQFNNG